jgi:hypothetical protein
MEPTDTHQDTNTKLKVPYSDTVDHQTNTTEEPSSTRPSVLCTQLHHMEQNIVMRTSQNNQLMSDTVTQVQQFNKADHMNHHENHFNNSNRLNTNNNLYHDTALSSSRDSKTSLHTNPTAQISGGNEYNMHWKPADNIHYNTKPDQKDICSDKVHCLYTEDARLEDMTITTDLPTDSYWNSQRHTESATNISIASNDSTQRPCTNTIYISGSIMSHTRNGVTQLERPTLQEVEQGKYPQESATRVTSAGTVSLTTPQSGGADTGTTSETLKVR